MNRFHFKFGKRKPKRGRTKKSAWMHTLSSSSIDIIIIQEVLSQTFECERFHCRLLPEICVQRQKSWDPEIYKGCMGCKQGSEMAKRLIQL